MGTGELTQGVKSLTTLLLVLMERLNDQVEQSWQNWRELKSNLRVVNATNES